jgi:hypothetical protein
MTFHRTIKSNDGLGFWGAIFTTVLFAFGLFFLYGAFYNDDAAGKIFMLLWLLFIGAGCLLTWSYIFFPQEWEFVFAEDIVRWGNAQKPHKQKRLETKSIAAIYFDTISDGNNVYAVTKEKKRIELPAHIIWRKSYAKELKSFLSDHFPEIAQREGFPSSSF